jgi:hypothetical protein
MRIVMVNNYLYVRGGSERVMFEEAETLGHEGIEVSYFGQQREENPPLPHSDLFPAYVDPFSLSAVNKLMHVPKVSITPRSSTNSRSFWIVFVQISFMGTIFTVD